MDMIILSAEATGLPVAITVDRIVAIAARPKLDVRGKPMTSNDVPMEIGSTLSLDGSDGVLVVNDTLDEILDLLERGNRA